MTNLFNNAALKRHLLDRIKVVSPAAGDKFTRVSAQAMDDLDYRFRKIIDDYLRAQRVGKTITTP